MVERVEKKKADIEDFKNVDIDEKNERFVECVLADGETCLCPIIETQIKGYKFVCSHEDCEEEIIGVSKEEVISKAESHLIQHSSYY